MDDQTFILHHYDPSPFSEKVRLLFGLKGLAWASVITPNIMPKPDLTPLTGGYRRAPVMQIGADIWCDTQAILAEINRRVPGPGDASGADWAVNLWADRLFFQSTVPLVFAEIGRLTPKAFFEDREKLSGRPFDLAALEAAAGPLAVHWRAQAAWIEAGLAAGPYLAGKEAGLADVAAYFNIWWLSAAAPGPAARLLQGLDRTLAWRDRLRARGHGARSEYSGAEALDVARRAEPVSARAHDPHDPLGLAPGALVVVQADDYGRDPVDGVLVSADPSEIVIARQSADLGRLHLHFPRTGYIARPAP